MKAFKTFNQVPNPLGIPANWPSEAQACTEDQRSQLESEGFTVVTEEDYLTYLATHQAEYDAWDSTRVAVATAKEIKIFDYLTNTIFDKTKPPVRVDFVTSLDIKLHRKSFLVKGECVKEEFYQTATVNPTTGAVTYSNLIVKEESVYTRNYLGFPVMKTSTISYALRDNTFHSTTKSITKVYSSLEQIDEGKTRRGNLVDNLQMPCIGLISIALIGTPNATGAVILEGRKFLADYKNEFESFVAASDKTILTCLTDPNHARYMSISNYSWIDTMTPYGITIRAYLINELTI